MFVVNVIALGCGIFLPLLTVSKLVLIQNTFSIYSGVQELYDNDQYFLFLVIGVFSLVFPIAKLTFLGAWLINPYSEKLRFLLRFVHAIGKWSMLDVFVVAVLVVAVKLAGLASVQMREGLYFFTVSVVLTMMLTQMLLPFYERRVLRTSDGSS